MNDISEPAIPPVIAHLYTKQASVRNDYVNYFDYSGESGMDNPSHFPILVTSIDENGKPKVRALKNKNELLDLPDDTQCVGQWRGENRSDFFEFTALQYKQHVENVRKRAEEEHKRKEGEEEKRKSKRYTTDGDGNLIDLDRLHEMMAAARAILRSSEVKSK